MIRKRGYFPCTILCPEAGFSNPYGVEGLLTIAFEIVASLGRRAPQGVFVPVGSGDGVYGIWKGFRELSERNLIAAAPRMFGCHAQGANSAARAWRAGLSRVEALLSVQTVALSVAELATGSHALRAIQESHGSMMEASDAAIPQAAEALRKRGLALEPAPGSIVCMCCSMCWRCPG